jgi:hypothetical protein
VLQEEIPPQKALREYGRLLKSLKSPLREAEFPPPQRLSRAHRPQAQPSPEAQAMVGSAESTSTLYRMGTDTLTRWVTVTVQLAPPLSVSQVTMGGPWQVMVAASTSAVGVRVRGWVISTDWVPTLLQLPEQLPEGHRSSG